MKVKKEEKNMLKKGKLEKKTVIIILAVGIALMIISIAALLGRMAARRDRTPQPPARYFAKSENLSSVTEVVGDRRFETVTDGAVENREETSAAEPAETSETGLTESAAAEEKGENIERYAYFPTESVEEDVTAYMDYLKSEKTFLDVTEGEGDPEEGAQTRIYRLSGPSEDEKCHLEITIEIADNSYTLTAAKVDEPWNSYVSGLWTEEKKKEANRKPEEAVSSMEMAQEAVKSLGEARLNLPKPIDQYDFRTGMGVVNVDGRDYYKVGTYERQENGTVTYECAYLVDYDSGAVAYKYNDATDEKEALK